MKNKVYVFDLDRTLLDTDAMKEGIAKALDVENLTTDFVLEKLEEKDERLLNFLKEKTKEYIFPRVIDELEKIAGEKILLTMGNLELQKIKVEAMPELKKQFSKILYPKDSNEKIEMMKDLYQEYENRIISFNDNKKENKEFIKFLSPDQVIEINKIENDLVDKLSKIISNELKKEFKFQ